MCTISELSRKGVVDHVDPGENTVQDRPEDGLVGAE